MGRRLPDCLRIFSGFWGGGYRIAYVFYGFLPDCGEEASGLFTDFFRILGGFRFVYGFFPDFGEETSGLLTEFDWTSGLCTDFNRIFSGD